MESNEKKVAELNIEELETVVGGITQVKPRDDGFKYGGDVPYQKWDQEEYLRGQEEHYRKLTGDYTTKFYRF